MFIPQTIYRVQRGFMCYDRNINIFYPIIYVIWLFSDIFSVYLSLYGFQWLLRCYYVKIKFDLVDKLNLILTNLTLYDQLYFTAISDSPTRLNQTIWSFAVMLLLIDIPHEIIFYSSSWWECVNDRRYFTSLWLINEINCNEILKTVTK